MWVTPSAIRHTSCDGAGMILRSLSKKQKLHASFANTSPFPEFAHPTPAEALEVHKILSGKHPPPVRRPPPRTATNNSAQTCGDVPNVMDALIGTILSQNTSAINSTRAKKGLDDAFGHNNFEAMASAPRDQVVHAISAGGLANKKAAVIQALLHQVKARHGAYSLQHLAGEGQSARLQDEEIMHQLLSYDGIGPKTAACVLLFCLGRDSFAVDTHVYRLTRLLGWIPAKANRVLAQAHLDARVPAHLKYGLHVLMVQHGRACKGCQKRGARQPCPLKDYLKQRGAILEEDIKFGR